MTNLHYEFTGETREVCGATLHRIRATRDLPKLGVKSGDVGGWIEHTGNLAGNAWVDDEAQVFGNAKVFGDAKVYGNARVSGNAMVYGNAKVSGGARVLDNAWVLGIARVFGVAWVYGDAKVGGYAQVYGYARIERDYDYLYTITCTSSQFNLTLTRQKDGKHLIRMGCWSGTIDKFEALIAQPKWIETKEEDTDEARPEMEALASMMRARIERWK